MKARRRITLFASDLARSNAAATPRHGWSVTELARRTGSAVFPGHHACGTIARHARPARAWPGLKYEGGVPPRAAHVPVTQGRIHTSAVGGASSCRRSGRRRVVIINDLRIDVTVRGGPGSQSVNDRLCRAYHLPAPESNHCRADESRHKTGSGPCACLSPRCGSRARRASAQRLGAHRGCRWRIRLQLPRRIASRITITRLQGQPDAVLSGALDAAISLPAGRPMRPNAWRLRTHEARRWRGQ